MRTRAQAARSATSSRAAPNYGRRASTRVSKAKPRPIAIRKPSSRVTRSSATQEAVDHPILSDSDEESSYVSDHPNFYAPPRRARKRPSAARVSGPEPSYRRPKRRRHESGYYDEDEGRDEDDLGYGTPYFSPTPVPETGHPDAPPMKPAKIKAPSKAKAKAARTRASPKDAVATDEQDIVKPAVIPPWATLPYHVLTQIFEYAATPLDDMDTVRWLLTSSRICHAFAEPALTALYKSPPLLSQSMAHKLVALLTRPPSRTMFNYRQKVESLVINVGDIATRMYVGQHLNVKALVQHLPRLTELDFYHDKDMPPYRQLDDNLRWHYPSGLFVALGIDDDSDSAEETECANIKLRSWRWSARMMGQEVGIDKLEAIHSRPSMKSLQKLILVNFQRPSLRSPEDAEENPELFEQDRAYAEILAFSLKKLSSLKHLVLESSTAANELLLPLLPKTIEHLELINCWDVTADYFSDYLMSHGRNLKYLTLHHNQSLSLSFLPILGLACPNLRALRMNLTYYNHHEFYNDSDPMYDFLLLADQVPTWPTSLEVLELEQLRRWSTEAAETFFLSLEQSSHTLPNLRFLSVKAMLDIPWRQRCEIRDKWVGRLNQVFLRPTHGPVPFHSLGDFPKVRHLYGGSAGVQSDVDMEDAEAPTDKRMSPVITAPSRRSARIAAPDVADTPSSSQTTGAGRLARRSKRGGISYREPDTDEDESAQESSEDALIVSQSSRTYETRERRVALDPSSGVPATATASDSTTTPVQGKCLVVDIRFDNQKPTERQYGMNDFLDSDGAISDDEEWHSDIDVGGNTSYAW